MDDDRNPVELLADEFLLRFRQGECPSVAEYAKKYPEHASQIQDLFPSLTMMEQFKRAEDQERKSLEHTSRFSRERFESLGEYEIIREIGRGGMGVVFEAKQKSLDRRVAIKVLSIDVVSSPKQLKRFQREAQSAARLHHTNIVPVFGVGEHEGTHFYVMQLIHGVGFDEIVAELNGTFAEPASASSDSYSANAAAQALCNGSFVHPKKLLNSNGHLSSSSASGIRVGKTTVARTDSLSDTKVPVQLDESEERPSTSDTQEFEPVTKSPSLKNLNERYWKSAARIGLQAAEALQYAHLNGIVHRDVKPSNLLLDRNGITWVTDFGLAKHQEQDAMTKTGDVVGTLRYMSPEQLNGQSDARGDVYSLGLVVYELLTLAPAFEDTKAGALIKRKTEGQLTPPRTINRAIPRDLETITMKACATDPVDRYQTAGDLALDLENYLEDRPITARRTTPIERLVRWSRRNPALAALSGTATALLLLVAVVASAGYASTQAALTKANEANTTKTEALAKEKAARRETRQALDDVKTEKTRAEEEKVRAEKNLEVAVAAFDKIFENVAERGAPKSLGLDFDDEEEIDFESSLTSADVRLLTDLLGFYEAFAQQNSEDDVLRGKTADAYRRIGDIYSRLKDRRRASESYQRALRIYDELLATSPNNVAHVVAKAELLNRLGIVYTSPEGAIGVVVAHHAAIAFLESQERQTLETNEVRYELGRSYDLVGSVFIRIFREDSFSSGNRRPPPPPNEQVGDRPPVPKSSKETNEGGRPPKSQERRSTRLSRFFAEWRKRTGTDDPRQHSRDMLAKGAEILERLVELEPTNVKYRVALAVSARHRFERHTRDHKLEEAEEALAAAQEHFEVVISQAPNNPRYRFELADTLAKASSQLSELRSGPMLLDFVRQAIEHSHVLLEQHGSVPEYQALMASCFGNLADIERSMNMYEEAVDHYGIARSRLRMILEQDTRDSLYHKYYGIVTRKRAELGRFLYYEDGNEDHLLDSLRLLDSTIEEVDALPVSPSNDRRVASVLASLYHGRSGVLRDLGRGKEADASEEKALEIGGKPRGPRARGRPKPNHNGTPKTESRPERPPIESPESDAQGA